jgi:Tol biopolymer transport system component
MLRRSRLRIAAAALAAAIAGAWGVEPAGAAFPGTNGRLLARIGALSAIASINLDGSGRRDLHESGEEAAWSPDGSRVAFQLAGKIWIVDSDGTGAHSLGVEGYAPTWSPDGTRIAYSANGSAIDVVNADGTGFTQLSSGNDVEPSWSPDGTKIAFSRYRPITGGFAADIWTMDADGENEQLLYENGETLVGVEWAPDGSKLVFQRAALVQIFTIDADGSDPKQLTTDGFNRSPVFSPTARQSAS